MITSEAPCRRPRRPRRASRAVSAAEEFDAALLRAPLLSPALPLSPPLSCASRHCDFEALVATRLRGDPHAAARDALHALQSVPRPRDGLSVLDAAALHNVLSFLGVYSRDTAMLSATCRRCRRAAISAASREGFRCVLSPAMVSAAALGRDATAHALCAAFASWGRGQHVRALRLVNNRDHMHTMHHMNNVGSRDSGNNVSVPPLCAPGLFPSLAKCMPSLCALDLRGVRFAEPPLAPSFLGALHRCAPRLRSLKVPAALCEPWAPGWWQRHPPLEEFVVGARSDAAGPAPLALPDDFFAMLRAPQRRWRVRLWAQAARDALPRLLLPSAPFPELAELAVNIGGADFVDDARRRPSRSPRDGQRKGAKKASQVSEEGDPRTLFPALEALTIANVEGCAAVPVAIIERIAARAPCLKIFNITNTARPPPKPKPKHKQIPPRTHVE